MMNTLSSADHTYTRGLTPVAPVASHTRIGAGVSRDTAVDCASASANASPVGQRSSALFARHLSIACATLPGTPGATEESGGAGGGDGRPGKQGRPPGHRGGPAAGGKKPPRAQRGNWQGAPAPSPP